MSKKFSEVAMTHSNEKWENVIRREKTIYSRNNELRNEFERDYTRVVFSNGYKRLKSKTQVFFSPKNDHVCTRSEHVNYVETISHTIAKALGLNEELTRVIAIAHDIGHAPFGHAGERILNQIATRDCDSTFWHERNGIILLDNFELLDNPNSEKQNMNLTYGVRDGIISHCGEVDENCIRPRDEYIDLEKEYLHTNQYNSYTWEGCVVKVSDKISYIVRDIEDAIRLKILNQNDIGDLHNILNLNENESFNNGVVINELINDIVENSTPEEGLKLSPNCFEKLTRIKSFNYEKIYRSDKMKNTDNYFKLIINTIYDFYKELYDGGKLYIKRKLEMYDDAILDFAHWLRIYSINFESDIDLKEDMEKYNNEKIVDLRDPKNYYSAIIEYISGMTDNKAIEVFNKIISFN